MIQYTIDAVKQSKYKNQIEHIISSNSSEILEYASSHTRTMLHPDFLSEDGKSAFGVVKYLTQKLIDQGGKFDLVLILRATSPLRHTSDIDNALDLFGSKNREGYSSIVGYTPLYTAHPQRMRYFDGKNLLNIYQEKEHSLRQHLSPKLLVRNEAIYVTTPDLILHNTIWGNNPYPYLMPPERSININNIFDFLLAEAILQQEEIKPSSPATSTK